MSIDFDDIPTVDSAGRLGRAVAADSPFVGAFAPPANPTLEQLSGLGLGFGDRLADSLRARIFPNSMLGQLRDAAAKTYTTYYDCGGFSYDGTCQQPCFGPEPQYMNPFYCATCAEQQADPNQNPSYFWHYTGSRQIGSTNISYWGENNICAGKGAWKWKIDGNCGSCSKNSTIRCHDGYKQVQGQAPEWTICEGLVICDDKLNTCP